MNTQDQWWNLMTAALLNTRATFTERKWMLEELTGEYPESVGRLTLMILPRQIGKTAFIKKMLKDLPASICLSAYGTANVKEIYGDVADRVVSRGLSCRTPNWDTEKLETIFLDDYRQIGMHHSEQGRDLLPHGELLYRLMKDNPNAIVFGLSS